MTPLLLLLLALVPGIILLYFILFMDRSEKEPLGLVMFIIFLGAVSVAPAAFLEVVLQKLPIHFSSPVTQVIFLSFFQVAWVEELLKLSVVMIFAWRSKDFNEENDGIVYVGASALGFAMLENVFYVMSSGMMTGILRSMTAMPLHCFTGILMGYYVGLAKMTEDKKARKQKILKGFLLAFFIHGIYDSLALSQTPAALIILPLIAALVVMGFNVMKKGRALSLARQEQLAGIQTDETVSTGIPAIQPAPEFQLWKVIVSRILLSSSALFWIMITLAIFFPSTQTKSQTLEILMGGVMFSFLPIFIGVILEISYRRKTKVFQKYREASIPEQYRQEYETKRTFSINKDTSSSVPDSIPSWSNIPGKSYQANFPHPSNLYPPGHWWRIIVSRTFLVLSGLLWAVLVLVVVSSAPSSGLRIQQAFLIGIIVTLFPTFISIILEDSSGKRKKIFNWMQTIRSVETITAKDIALSPPNQTWKISISRFLFGSCMIAWVLTFLGEGKLQAESTSQTDFASTFVGMIILTIIPVALAIILEKSYQKRKKRFWIERNYVPLIRRKFISLF